MFSSLALLVGGAPPASARRVPAATQQPAASVGWRNDGGGHFPSTAPPTTWSTTVNVRWSAKTPAWSNASPVVVGKRVFICAEPTTLLCFSTDDGHLLWQAQNDYADTLVGDEAARARVEIARSREVEAELVARQKELSALKRVARKVTATAETRAQLEQLTAKMNQLKIELDATARYRTPPTQDMMGYSSITPVSDGKSVYVLYANGVLASYDLEGHRRYIHFLGPSQKPMIGYDDGSAASLRLSDGVLIVPYGELRGLDAATGAELWRGAPYKDYGTPALVRVGPRELLVTPSGDLYDPRDGRGSHGGLSRLFYVGPISDGARVYFIGSSSDDEMRRSGSGQAAAWQLGDDVGAAQKLLWQAKLPPQKFYASPLFDAGLIYAVSNENHLVVLDAATGKIESDQQLPPGDATHFASPALAGGHLFVSSTDGSTLVMRPGLVPSVESKNELEPFRASLFFVGRRLYVRAFERLYCIEEAQPGAAPATR